MLAWEILMENEQSALLSPKEVFEPKPVQHICPKLEIQWNRPTNQYAHKSLEIQPRAAQFIHNS
jgi:hypothetical protein